jgi:S-methylmethionine-dependent homocysteine/selenocysteine methylase
MSLPQLTAGRPYLTDGGLETTLVFHQGLDLPDFAAFPLLDTDPGRAALRAYYTPYLRPRSPARHGFVLDTPTWRANLDWGARQGYDAVRLSRVNHRAVELVAALAASYPSVPVVLNGVVGPRGDGYVVGETMSAPEAAAYHALQARAFAEAGAHMMSAITMTYAEEAIGVARAAGAVGLPAVVSFTVETDGRLPSGQALSDAIAQVDDACRVAPAYYMVNCAHPTHFSGLLTPDAAWLSRVRAVRANASRLSHAELDEATELDRGDIEELGALHADLASVIDLRVVGGCCGTDHEHVAAIADALSLSGSR